MLKFMILFMPSFLRIKVLRFCGAKIGVGCFIGMSIIDAKDINIGDHVHIASFNIVHRLASLTMHRGSRMNGFNWITGGAIGYFNVGRNTAITRLHFFEASGGICLGDNTIIAGRNSHFFTHGISSTNLDDVRPIIIGPWCYIGSSSRFVPGSSIGKGTFVGMGAVVSKVILDEYVLVGGVPARVLKRLSADHIYFDRLYLPHDHHPIGFDGSAA
jgi:carbonic anhydrase/acetyltransferase-like protein (isoleucine patch superfamily)